MGMRALLAGSAVLMGGVVACSSASGAVLSPASASGARRTAKAATAAAAASVIVREGLCTAPAARRALAAQVSADIWKGLRGRNGEHAVSVYDRVTGVYCVYNGSKDFDSARIVKAFKVAALLRGTQERKPP